MDTSNGKPLTVEYNNTCSISLASTETITKSNLNINSII